MSSPAAKGLFYKAIAESAQQSPIRGQSVKRYWLEPAEELDAKFLAIVGAKNLAELRAMPAENWY